MKALGEVTQQLADRGAAFEDAARQLNEQTKKRNKPWWKP